MRLIQATAACVAVSLAIIAMPARAQQFIPAPCIELAVREGYPLPETKIEITAARARLWTMSKRDPLVRKCRSAIDQLKLEMKR